MPAARRRRSAARHLVRRYQAAALSLEPLCWRRLRSVPPGGVRMRSLRRFTRERAGLATIEYVIGAAVVLGTLVVGVSAWNNGLVSRLQSLVTQLSTVR